MQQSQIYAWLSESLNRLFIKSPVYFTWWKRLSGGIALIASLPTILAFFHVIVPLPWAAQVNHLIAAAAYGVFFMSQIPVKDPTMVITSSSITGETVAETIVKPSLPFTANKAAEIGVKVIDSNIPYSGGQDTTATVIKS